MESAVKDDFVEPATTIIAPAAAWAMFKVVLVPAVNTLATGQAWNPDARGITSLLGAEGIPAPTEFAATTVNV